MSTPTTPDIDTTKDRPPRARRRIPVSLKAFAAVLVLLGVACLWLVARGYRQMVAIREIERAGGAADTTSGDNEWLRAHLGDEWTRMFDEVREVYLRDTKATDDTLYYVGRLHSLKKLFLGNTSVTDAGVARLKGLTKLDQLDLSG